MVSLPNKPKIIESKDNQATFEIEPCHPGYGTTLGNALRRALLSSLPGAAITGVKIKGIQHEFSTIPHVLEDVVQIILNLKQIRIKLHTDQPVRASLKVKGEKEVKAGDIKTGPEAEVANKDAHIATLTDKKADLEMEIEIEPGLGYSPVEERKKEKLEISKIAVDAIFSPVVKVNYSIANIRVGERTDYDRLRITIETDGTVTPKEAFLKAADILLGHFKMFTVLEEEKKPKKETRERGKKEKSPKRAKEVKEDLTKAKVKDLKISSRTIAILDKAGLKTVAGLIRKKVDDLKKIEGLGDKGILEIKRTLGKLGLTLKS